MSKATETGLVLLAAPRGFCAGVERAIEIVERALQLYGAPVYVLHEIVHNRYVLEDFRARGVRFVESLSEVPRGAVAIFSAHGVAQSVEELAAERDLRVIDATCPLVTKVHLQARRYEEEERELVLIGHEGHPEVEGTRGRTKGRVYVLSTVEEVEALVVSDPERLAYVTQTTLSVDDTREVVAALERRFPGIKGPDLADICYATQNRQNAVKAMAGQIDALIVVGSRNSSNSSRLLELGVRLAVPAYRVDSAAELDPAWFRPEQRVGVTAGASAPESLVEEVVRRLGEFGIGAVSEMEGEQESVVFNLPAVLRSGVVTKA